MQAEILTDHRRISQTCESELLSHKVRPADDLYLYRIICINFVWSGLFQMPLWWTLSNGSVQSTFLQTLSTEEMFWDWNAEGVHPYGRGKTSEAAENWGKSFTQDVHSIWGLFQVYLECLTGPAIWN